MSEKIIDEVMGLVQSLRLSEQMQDLEAVGQCEESIRAKLREVLERKPLSTEDLYELTRNAGPEIVELGQKWADNEIHVYQYTSQAEAIIDGVVRDAERAHHIGAE